MGCNHNCDYSYHYCFLIIIIIITVIIIIVIIIIIIIIIITIIAIIHPCSHFNRCSAGCGRKYLSSDNLQTDLANPFVKESLGHHSPDCYVCSHINGYGYIVYFYDDKSFYLIFSKLRLFIMLFMKILLCYFVYGISSCHILVHGTNVAELHFASYASILNFVLPINTRDAARFRDISSAILNDFICSILVRRSHW